MTIIMTSSVILQTPKDAMAGTAIEQFGRFRKPAIANTGPQFTAAFAEAQPPSGTVFNSERQPTQVATVA